MRPHQRLRFFSAPPDDILFADPLAVWIVNQPDGTVEGYSERGRRKFRATGFPTTPPLRGFCEARDGWQYGIFEDGPNGEQRMMKRWRIVAAALEIENLASLPSTISAGSVFFANIGRIIFAGSDGGVFLIVQETPAPAADGINAKVFQPMGFEYRRLDTGTLVLSGAGVVPEAVPTYSPIINVGKNIQAIIRSISVKRRIYPAILSDKRWVAVDAIPTHAFSTASEWGLVEWDGPSGGQVPRDTFISRTVRIWGKGWWERADHAASWSGLDGTTLETATQNFTRNAAAGRIREADLTTPPNPSSHGTVRINKAGSVPNTLVDRFFWNEDEVSYRALNLNIPDQDGIIVLQADRSSLYLLQQSIGVNKARIPASGQSPSWSLISSATSMNSLVVSRTKIWIGTAAFLKNGGSTDIRLPTFTEIAPAFQAMWR